MTQNITTGTTTTNTQMNIQPSDLAPNNYLTIIWKDSQGNVINTLDGKSDDEVRFTTELNNAITQSITSGKVNYVGQTKYLNIESIAKYISQNTITAGAKRQVINALITVASGDNKTVPTRVTDLCLNVFGTIAEKTARKLNFTDPHEIFSQVAGENVIGILKELGQNSKDLLEDAVKKINNTKLTNLATKVGLLGKGQNVNSNTVKRYVGLVLGLTTSDTESIEIINAKRKVEKGNDYTTHLLPQLFKKDFTVKLTNKVLSDTYNYETEINAIEFTKNKLIEIANSQTLFDIYIKLSDNIMYKRENLTFTSISFDKGDGDGNGYTCTFSVEPIVNFKTKIFVSNKKYGSKASSKGSGSSGSGSKSNRKQADKSANGQPFQVGYYYDRMLKDYNQLKDVTWTKGYEELQNYAKQNNFAIVEQYNTSPRYLLVNNNNIKYAKVNNNPKNLVLAISSHIRKNGALGNNDMLPPIFLDGDPKNGVITCGKGKYKVTYWKGWAL